MTQNFSPTSILKNISSSFNKKEDTMTTITQSPAALKHETTTAPEEILEMAAAETARRKAENERHARNYDTYQEALALHDSGELLPDKSFSPSNEASPGIATLPANETTDTMRSIPIKDMEEYGYRSAGDAKGNIHILLNQFNLILRGHLTDEHARTQLRASSKEQIRKEIEDLERDIRLKQLQAEDLEQNKLPQLKKEEHHKRDELESFTLSSLDPNTAKQENGYDAFAYWLNLGFLMSLTLFSLLYYYLLGHNALYRNIGKEISQATGGEKLEILFTGLFNPRAFTDTPLPWMLFIFLLSTLFLGMGYMTHTKMLKQKPMLKGFLWTLLIFIDAFFAYQMDKNIYTLQFMATNEGEPWEWTTAFKDFTFYAILIIGFLSYFLMGLFLQFFSEERQKSDPTLWHKTKKNILEEQLKRLNEMREDLEKTLLQLAQDIESIKSLIRKKQHDLNAEYFNRYDCERMMDFFLKGWMRYLAGMENGEALTATSMAMANDFKNKHLFNHQ
jgi:hypothetical protein